VGKKLSLSLSLLSMHFIRLLSAERNGCFSKKNSFVLRTIFYIIYIQYIYICVYVSHTLLSFMNIINHQQYICSQNFHFRSIRVVCYYVFICCDTPLSVMMMRIKIKQEGGRVYTRIIIKHLPLSHSAYIFARTASFEQRKQQ